MEKDRISDHELNRLKINYRFSSHPIGQLTGFLVSERDRTNDLEDQIEKIKKGGWRSCIDHIIRPDSPCPVCEINALNAQLERAKELNLECNTHIIQLLDQLHAIANFPDPDFPAEDEASEAKRAWDIIYTLKDMAKVEENET
jgi:hypothetical protein